MSAARLQDTDDLDQAEQHYLALRAQAPDPERKRVVEFELAKIQSKRGDKKAALQSFLAIAKHKTKDNPGAKALYESARILYENDIPASLLLYQKVIAEYPEFVAADFSLTALRIHYLKQEQYDEFLLVLDQLFQSVSQTNLANHILYTRAKLLEDHFHNDNEALLAYRQLYTHCKGCSLSDESVWQMAQIYIRHQHWQPATEILITLAEKIIPSWFVGTYNSARAGDARYLLAEINMLFLDDYTVAERQFNLYIKDFPNSTRTDDAAWNIVEIKRLSGNEDAYKKNIDEFVRKYPESRYVRVAQDRITNTQSSTSRNTSGNNP